MKKKNIVIFTIVVFLVGIIITTGSYAFWSWNSNANKTIVFNTAGDLKNYIVYDEGESQFAGELDVSNSYLTGGIHSTISIYKTSAAANANLVATIHMDINKIGEVMKTSNALKWTVTEGTPTDVGDVLAQGNFAGAKVGDTLTLVPNITVTTTRTFYTIWIWIDENANPSPYLSGETLDTDIWTEVNQEDSIEDIYEITRLSANYQNINATVVDSQAKIVKYAVTTSNVEPSSNSNDWVSIDTIDQANVYTLNTSVNVTGTYYVYFKDENNRVTSKNISVNNVDATGPQCTWGSFVPASIADREEAHIDLTCVDSESGTAVNNLLASDITTSNNKITVTNVTKEIVQDGYKYVVTIAGTSSDGSATLTLPINKVKNTLGVGNISMTSSNVIISNIYTVSYQTNDNACPLDSTIYATGQKSYSTTFVVTNPECEGYTFMGWTADSNLDTTNAKYGANDANTTWDNSSTPVKGDSMTFFSNLPLFSAKTITLTANFVDDTAPSGSVNVDYENGVISASTNASDAGSGLDGKYYWKVSNSSVCDNTIPSTDFTEETTNTFDYTIPQSDFYYACLKVSDNAGNTNYIRSHKISDIIVDFNANGGSELSMMWNYVALNQPYGELPTAPTKTGYKFAGWTQYQQIEYIESTGTQYINTNYYPSQSTGVYADYQFTATTTQQRLFSVDSDNSSNKVSYAFYINGNTQWAYAHVNGVGNWVGSGKGANTVRHTIDFGTTDGNIYIDNGSTYSAAISGAITNVADYPMLLFARNNMGSISNYAKSKLYDFDIYENYVINKNFVPCYRISDNAGGLCDTISGEFYPNRGTGVFNLGPAILSHSETGITSNTLVTTSTNHTLYANWVDDILPTGTVTLNEDDWIVTATVNASDTGSGIKNNYGFMMREDATCDSTVTGFVETTESNYTFSDSISSYVCVRIEDNAGNYNYISARTAASYYRYTGELQSFTASQAGYYAVEMYGASGGTAGGAGGFGGALTGYIYLNQNDTLYLQVGSQGTNTWASGNTGGGGYNGGGAGSRMQGSGSAYLNGAGGGGATDIRLVGGTWDDATSLNSRIMVAAGGGGGSYISGNYPGGSATGLIGANGTGRSMTVSPGGTTTGYSFGSGQDGIYATGSWGESGRGGGGAGYYGGYASQTGANGIAGGGAGSSFISGYAGVNAITSSTDRTHTNATKHYSNKYFIDGEMAAGTNSGNGKVKIAYYGANEPTRTNTDLSDVRYIRDCISGNTVNTENSWNEIQAIYNGVNIAKGKTVTITGTLAASSADHTYTLESVVNGDINDVDNLKINEVGYQCVTIDLASAYNLDEIAVWHYFADGRTYNDNNTYVSSDKLYWKKAIDNADAESANGKRVNAWDSPLEDNEPVILYDTTYQVYPINETGYYKIEAWGAEGGNAHTTYTAGKGGYSSGYVYLNQGDNLYIYVSEKGSVTSNAAAQSAPATFNGGGNGYNHSESTNRYAGAGGGATDIRYFGTHAPTEQELVWNSELGLNSRIMVAGGGGGSWYYDSSYRGTGGNGGTLLGGTSVGNNNGTATSGTGGTQSAVLFGYGKNAGTGGRPGGGGGYYGGNSDKYTAGGGSSFISGYAGVNAITASDDRTHTGNTKHYSNKYFIKGEMAAGVNSGNGRINITYYGANEPTRTNTDLNNVRYIRDCINGSTANADNSWVELQAIKDGINLAKGRTVVGSVPEATGYEYTYITDGLIDNTTATTNYGKSVAAGKRCITLDLGSAYNLDEIAVWHYFADERTFNDNTTYVSSDKQYWKKAIENSNQESANGKRVNAWDEPLQDNDLQTLPSPEYQVYQVSQSGYYRLEVWGAQGGSGTYATGGLGGYSSGYVYLNENDKLYIYTGIQSAVNYTGYNGAGEGGTNISNPTYGGGGATDIRYFGSYTPTSSDLEWNSTLGLNSRIIVAGGGGGGYSYSNSYKANGAAGGNLIGANGIATKNAVATGGTQTSGGIGNNNNATYNGSFGIGGGVADNTRTGGGGGYYGGGGTYNIGSSAESGAGGSSFISGYAGVNAITAADDRTHTDNTKHYSNKYFIDGEMQAGVNSVDGRYKITYIGNAPTRTNTDLNGVRYIRDCVEGSSVNNENSWVELQAIKDGINLAKGRTVVGMAPEATGYEYTYITDGLIDNTTATTNYGKASVAGKNCITIDLGSSYNLDELAVWHYFADGRTFNNNTTYVSNDKVYWKKAIDNIDSESSNGKRVNAWDEPITDNELRTLPDTNAQVYPITQSGYYKLEVWGAQGGSTLYNNATGQSGGLGAYAAGYVYLNQGDNLYIYTGGKGGSGVKAKTTALAGWNGGGTGDHDNSDDEVSGGGGGATDIRYFGSYTPTSSDLEWDSTLGLNSRIIVAGGGGGAADVKIGLPGGTLVNSNTSSDGFVSTLYTASGQDTGYAFGIGGNGARSANNYPPSGGGGGYYGGIAPASGSNYFLIAGGGSSFVSGYAGANAITASDDRTHTATVKHYSNKYFIDGEMQAGVNNADGKYQITYYGENAPVRTNTDLNGVRYIKDCTGVNSVNAETSWIELQAIKDGVNIAKGIVPTGTSAEATGYEYTYITDGLIDNYTATTNYGKASATGYQCITIDLQSTYNLDEIAVWHYFADGRTYSDNITYVSSDKLYWKKAIDNAAAESGNGKRVNAWDTPLQDNTPQILFDSQAQTYPITQSGYYKLEAWGAQGGSAKYSTEYAGGLGGYSSGYVYLEQGTNLYIYTGGSGTTVNGTSAATVINNSDGYNGGGHASFSASNSTGGGGGGATDIRLVGGAWDDETSLNSRILIAGGGGGAKSHKSTPSYSGAGGGGGTLIGSSATSANATCYAYGTGGKQVAGGTSTTCSSDGHAYAGNAIYGYGDTNTTVAKYIASNTYVGGGGGYYGGGLGYHAPGGGGSSFMSGYAGVNAINQGNVSPLSNVRYVRNCINGSSANTGNHWVELQVFSNGVNVASGLTATISNGTLSNPAYITNGNTTSSQYSGGGSGLTCITLDLNNVYDVSEIKLWHYYSDSRMYKENTTSVSSDNTSWVTVYNTSYAETSAGLTINDQNMVPYQHTNNTKHQSNKYFIDGEMQTGVNSGNGRVAISYYGANEPTRTNTDLNNVRYIRDCVGGSTVNLDNSWVELQAIKEGINLAKGKIVTGTANAVSGYEYGYITDGLIDNITSTLNYSKSVTLGEQCIIVDLEATYNLDELAVWHYYLDGRTFNNNTTYVSADGTFWKRAIQNTAAETPNGKRVNAWDIPFGDEAQMLATPGVVQVYPINVTGYYKLEAWGAQGGNYDSTYTGGLGAKASGYIYLNQGDNLYIYTGGQPVVATTANYSYGGANGGGNSGYNSATDYSRGGGGATDIRYFGSHTPTSQELDWNSELGLNSRIIVAAGGGGATYTSSYKLTGAAGGTLFGNAGVSTYSATAPDGGKQTTYGTGYHTQVDRVAGFGQGGGIQDPSTKTGFGGGGGAGYYGGALGYGFPGGSGSSFISGYAGVNAITSSSDRTHTDSTKHFSNKFFIDGEMSAGVNTGNGRVNITYYGINEPTRTNTDLANVRYIKDCIRGSSKNTGNHWIELQAIKDGINIAKGIMPVGTVTSRNDTTLAYTYITDGSIDNATSSSNMGQSNVNGLQCITIDLGSAYSLDEIAVWHYFADGRTYNENMTMVSSDGSVWKKVIQNTSAETPDGKRVNAWDTPLENSLFEGIICQGGSYLPANGSTCLECPAGSYCVGGIFEESSSVQGKGTCVKGSYSTAGQNACTACQPSGAAGSGGTTSAAGATSCNASCNKSNVSGWATATWDAATNTVSNSCIITSCSGNYGHKDNICQYCSGEWGYGSYNTCAGNCLGGECGYFYNSRTGYSQYNCSCYA